MTRYWIEYDIDGITPIGVRQIQGQNVPDQEGDHLQEVTEAEFETIKRQISGGSI